VASIDDFFVDLTGCAPAHGSAFDSAIAMRERIRAEAGLPVTIGIGTSKTLARLAGKITSVSTPSWRSFRRGTCRGNCQRLSGRYRCSRCCTATHGGFRIRATKITNTKLCIKSPPLKRPVRLRPEK